MSFAAVMQFVADLTVRGAIATLLAIALDYGAGRWLAARHRRLLWLLVPMAFLVPWSIPLPESSPINEVAALHIPIPVSEFSSGGIAVGSKWISFPSYAGYGLILWGFGAVAGMIIVAVRTIRASRRWGAHRFATDTKLLEVVEDCRQEARVPVPVGLIVSDEVKSPALLGWLRPKILLPAGWQNRVSDIQLRDVLLHEFAHLRRADLAWTWIFLAMRIVHCSTRWLILPPSGGRRSARMPLMSSSSGSAREAGLPMPRRCWRSPGTHIRVSPSGLWASPRLSETSNIASI